MSEAVSDPVDILLMIRARGIDVPFRLVGLIPSLSFHREL